ncbi:MAG TPA: phosphoesterase [Planctomycetota bacterium]|nr:phosphoesterase [Planctomycetota bacterium]
MEFVFVVPRNDLFRDCYPQGLMPFGQEYPLAAFEAGVARHGFFVQRSHAESNPNLKQVIPYTVVVRGGDVFLLRRLSKGGEARLANKLSIGVGGHINPEDATAAVNPDGTLTQSPIDNGSRREIAEEIHISGDTHLARVGVLNDDSNPVGAVHVGLVQLMVVEGDVRVREEDLLEGQFVSPEELIRLNDQGANFESWSKILVERLPELLTAHASPLSARASTVVHR